MIRLAALSFVAIAACGGGGDRSGLTADSAVGSGGTRPDSATRGSGDSAILASDSIGAGDSLSLVLPTLILTADSVAGDGLYRRKGKCLSCHGQAGVGIAGLGPNLHDPEWIHGDGSLAFIEASIRDGIARPKVVAIAMPAFATTLTPEEIRYIAAYTYALSHPGWVVADTTRPPPIDTLSLEAIRRPPPPP